MKRARFLFLTLACIISLTCLGQELVSNDHEKGYVKDGMKFSIWEYYNGGELELKIDHSSGKVYYIKEDTSTFVIWQNGEWEKMHLRVYPIPVEGYENFYESLAKKLVFPKEARSRNITGEVLVMFTVDNKGLPGVYEVVTDIGGGCGGAALAALLDVPYPWIPAQLDRVTYASRFILPVRFSLGDRIDSRPGGAIPPAKYLREVQVTGFGIERSGAAPGYMDLGDLPGEDTPREIKLNADQMDYLRRHGRLPRDYGRDESPMYVSLEEALKVSPNVRKLTLAGQQMGRLPKSVGKLVNLEFLDLEGNSLVEFPIELTTLEGLEELYAPHNQLTDLPEGFIWLKALKLWPWEQMNSACFRKNYVP